MKAARIATLIGLPVSAAAVFWLVLSPSDGERQARTVVAAQQSVAKPAAVLPRAQEAVVEMPATPTAKVPSNAEHKTRMASEGEANRIAAREARLAALDWDAPRPGALPPREPIVGKREAAMSAEDKLAQTVQMISLLKTRIDRTRERANARDTPMLERLEKRVVELNETAQVLQQQRDATGSAAPHAGDPGSSAPGDEFSAGTRG
jgi:hypothetical protein